MAPIIDPYRLAMEYGAKKLEWIGALQDTYLFKRPLNFFIIMISIPVLRTCVHYSVIQTLDAQKEKNSTIV